MKRETKKDTREVFIDTASFLFANKGYHAASISEILQKSGAPKGSLYYYFPKGKEQLAKEALQRTAARIFTDLKTSFAKDSPLEGMRDHILMIAENLERDLFQPNMSISLMALETFSSSETLRAECRDIFEEMKAVYRKNFLKLTDDAEKADFLAMSMLILVEGAIMLSLTYKDTSPLRRLARNLPLLIKDGGDEKC